MLEGKTAIVTGGSRGIGFAIAQELVNLRAKVVICSRNKVQLQKALTKLNKKDKVAYGVIADVSKLRDCKKLVRFARNRLKKIHILVNNAGIFGPIGTLETNDPKIWKKALEINLLGAVYCCMLTIPYMKECSGGRIINLAGAGVGGIQPLPRFTLYRTSKAAIVSFTENLAAELENSNIQVNAIAPGAVASELTLGLLKMDKSLVGEDMYKTSKKLQEKGGTSPKLVAKLVAFLVSDTSKHITGRLLSVKWDKIQDLESLKMSDQNLYRLRRIDSRLFIKSKE